MNSELLDAANRMRLSRISLPKNKTQEIEVKPLIVSDLTAMAEKIKNRRVAKMDDPKPLPTERYAHCKKAFLCRDMFKNQIAVFPTYHAVDRFLQRYPTIDNRFIPNSDNQVINKMREVFNSCTNMTDILMIERTAKYGNPKDYVYWGNGKFAFVVHISSVTIVTSELMGEYKDLN